MGQYRCLVVEDSRTMRNMLTESLLRISGMEVIQADNGLAGIRALAAQQFPDGDSDFALLELSRKPPESFGVYYAGWSAESTPPQSSMACTALAQRFISTW